jgi:hypothetical protein
MEEEHAKNLSEEDKVLLGRQQKILDQEANALKLAQEYLKEKENIFLQKLQNLKERENYVKKRETEIEQFEIEKSNHAILIKENQTFIAKELKEHEENNKILQVKLIAQKQKIELHEKNVAKFNEENKLHKQNVQNHSLNLQTHEKKQINLSQIQKDLDLKLFKQKCLMADYELNTKKLIEEQHLHEENVKQFKERKKHYVEEFQKNIMAHQEHVKTHKVKLEKHAKNELEFKKIQNDVEIKEKEQKIIKDQHKLNLKEFQEERKLWVILGKDLEIREKHCADL